MRGERPPLDTDGHLPKWKCGDVLVENGLCVEVKDPSPIEYDPKIRNILNTPAILEPDYGCIIKRPQTSNPEKEKKGITENSDKIQTVVFPSRKLQGPGSGILDLPCSIPASASRI